ncbi:MAG TPA: tetratricopeptide repeat protein, partial [Casimicrobiaceae bacterium]|nr:tetratricopeptide repeat protein [Casimicrobiaceae bacterium]
MTVKPDDGGLPLVISSTADPSDRQPRRNEPCPCGSGKRFKDCHGRLQAAAVSTARADAVNASAKAEAAAALARGEHEAAARSARRAVERHPPDPEAWNLLGLALEPSDPAAARAAWDKALALAPRDAEAHFRIGDFERRLGRHEAAIAAYRAALATGSRHPVLLNNLGLALRSTGRLDEAARSFIQALEQAPTLAQAHANLGDVLREQHRFAAAIPHYTRALELEPGVGQLWVNLGVCRHRIGLFDAAREAF